MQENQHQSLLTARGVVAFWLIYAASFLVLNLLLAPGRSLQDAIEAELLQGHLSGGYQLKNPPLYEWLLWTVQLVLGPGPLSYLVLRYALIATTGILFYLALLRTIPDQRLDAAFSISLVLFYWFGWESHHSVSHSLALLVALLAFWLVALAYIERPTAARALLLGLVIGLGIMAKWSFALFLVSFCIALAFDASDRRIFADRRSLLIPAAAAVPIIPFVLWLTRLDPTVIWLHSTRGGDLHGMLRSEANLLLSIPLLFLPWLLVVLFLAWRFRQGRTPRETPRSESWLALTTAAIAIALMAVVVALVSSGAIPWLTARSVAIRYLAPCSLIAALGIAGVIAARIEHECFASRLALISLAVAAILFLSRAGGLRKAPFGHPRTRRLHPLQAARRGADTTRPRQRAIRKQLPAGNRRHRNLHAGGAGAGAQRAGRATSARSGHATRLRSDLDRGETQNQGRPALPHAARRDVRGQRNRRRGGEREFAARRR